MDSARILTDSIVSIRKQELLAGTPTNSGQKGETKHRTARCCVKSQPLRPRWSREHMEAIETKFTRYTKELCTDSNLVMVLRQYGLGVSGSCTRDDLLHMYNNNVIRIMSETIP